MGRIEKGKGMVTTEFTLLGKEFKRGDVISWERYKDSNKKDAITISFSTADFDIEPTNIDMQTGVNLDTNEVYTKPFVDVPEITELMYHVQVEVCEGKFNVNKFLKTIDSNNFIDIKPMQNNWYMVVYKEK